MKEELVVEIVGMATKKKRGIRLESQIVVGEMVE